MSLIRERAEPRHAVGSGTRKDIQALRAFAVAAVVVYHLWPSVLPGGFVGVDVFFVISGYLITSHLLRTPPRRPADLVRFWAKRVLRLIPPVVIVVVAVLVGAFFFMSSGQWQRMSSEAVSSMFYVENWRLIADATDYLDANRAESPFQHFWSLSVEEQYYLFWPILVAGLAWVSRRRTAVATTRIYLVGFGAVVVSSFVAGVVLTASSPSEAYFSTFTRTWELGVGSLLAAAYPALSQLLSGATARLVLLWSGVVGLAVAVVVIDQDTAFPGYAALLPTVAAALVILAHDPPHRLNPRVLSHARPVQRLGDISYAMYLWHWPLIVLSPYVLDRPVSWSEKFVLLASSLVLAWASTTLVEDPIRSAPLFKGRPGRVLAMGAALSLVVVATAGVVHWRAEAEISQSSALVSAKLQDVDSCFGAGAMDPRHDCPADPKLVTSPAFAKADITNGIRGCLNWQPYPVKTVSCTVGQKKDPTQRIALFGNSHAGHWLEAMRLLGRQHGWQVDTFIMGICKTTISPQGVAVNTDTGTRDCDEIQNGVVDRIVASDYDLVVMSSLDRDPGSTPGLYRSTLTKLSRGDTHVLVIRDTPAPLDANNEPPDCVSRNLNDVSRCAGTPATWIGVDYMATEARRLDTRRITVADLNRYMCTKAVCPAVIGGVIAYSDYNHLSRTFSKTLAPYLYPALERGLREANRR
jgi:peptidoglycan/LPS O-acetylase OafA/YrhL